MSGRAVEAAGDVNTLLLDKTGTITLGNRQAAEFIPPPGVTEANWPMPRNFPRWPTRLPKAAPSWCWRKKNTACAAASLRAHEAALHPVHRADAHERRDFDGRGIRKGAANP